MFKVYDRVVHSRKNGPACDLDGFSGVVKKCYTSELSVVDFGERGKFLCENNDLSLVPDGPVRSITRRGIVPGTYGRVCVVTGFDGDGETSIKLADRGGSPHGLTMVLNAEELREAAHLFNQLAEALDDKP